MAAPNGRRFNVPPMNRPRHMRPHNGPNLVRPPGPRFGGGMVNFVRPPAKPRRDFYLPAAHGKEFLNQEKMFLPGSVDSLNENALCRQLMNHIPAVVERTGAEIRLEGGSPSDERLSFYVGHNNIVVFNEAKQLVIQMVQRVVTDMHHSTVNQEGDDDDVVLIDAILEENSRNSLPSNELQQKQFLIQNAIANHKHFLQAEMEKVKEQQMLEADDERQSMMELLDSAVDDGPEVITLEDERPPTAEELELKNQLEKLKKSASILKLAENVPKAPVGGRGMMHRNRMPHVLSQRPVEQYVLAPTRNVNHNNSANLKKFFDPNVTTVKEKQPKKSIQFNLGKLPPPPPPPPLINKKKNLVKLVPKDPVIIPADKPVKPTAPEPVAAKVVPKEIITKKGKEPSTRKLVKDLVKAIPLPKEAKVKSISTSDALESASIDPALDHMYHPSVNATVSQSVEDGVKNSDVKESQLKKTSAADKLQVGYLSDTEYGEDPYSELLNDSSHNEKGKSLALKNLSSSKPVNDDPEIISTDVERTKKRSRGQGRGRMVRKSVDEYQERENRRQSYEEDFSYRRHSLEERAPPSPEDPAVILEREKKMKERERKNYERRERENDNIERKNRTERRSRFEKLLKSGWLEELKREREKWEKEELRRVEVWEQDKKYVPEEEVEKCEMREEDRRERFEKERSYWLKKEAEELKQQLREEMESSSKEENKGPPVLYVLSISPNTTQSALFGHFARFGPVNRVVLIRTRVKNVLQAEVYFDSWAHIHRLLNGHSPAHYLDGYHLQLSLDKLNITCPITRMDEFKVDKRKESFDEILLKYKMQTELKKGRTADSLISQKPARLLPLRRKARTSTDGGPVVDLTSETETVRIPNKWQPEPINKNLRNTELEMHLQKMRFAGISSDITEITPESTEEELPRKVCLVLDPSMSYYDEETANQCRYPLLSSSGLCVNSSTKLIETHWSNTGKELVYSKRDGSFLNQMLYIVMPSTKLMLETAIGDNLQDNSLAKSLAKLSETNSRMMNEKLQSFMKSMRKNLNRVRRKDSTFNPLEMKALTSIISKAEEDIEAFSTDLKEDLATVRVFNLMRAKRVAALSVDKNMIIKEEKSVDFDLSITGENISIVFGDNVPEGGDRVDQSRLSGDCTLTAFVEFVGQQIKKVGRKDPITIDLEEGETSDTEQNNENEPQKDSQDPAEVIRNLLVRRLLHETFVMHEMIHVKNKFKESKEDKSVAFTDFCVKWLDKNEIKRAVNYAKTLKIIEEKSEVSLAVSSLFQFVKFYNCVARTSWLFASCPGPLMEGLQDALKEEGEVEEGEMEESGDKKKEERKKRRQQKREEKKKKELEREKEEDKRMKEMEILKNKLQEELASMGVEMEGEKFDKPPAEAQEEGEVEQETQEVVSNSFGSGRHSTMDILNILKNRPKEPSPAPEKPFTPTPFAPPPALGLKSKKYPKAAPFSGTGKQSRVAELDDRGRFMSQDMANATMPPPTNGPHQNMYMYPQEPGPMPNTSSMQNFGPNAGPIPNFMPNSGPMHYSGPMNNSGPMPNSGPVPHSRVPPLPVPSPFNPPQQQTPALISTCEPMPEGYSESDAAAGIKTTALHQSTLSSLKRVMNKQKKLSKAEIAAMIAKPKATVEAPKAIEEAIKPLAIEDQPAVDQSIEDQPAVDQSIEDQPAQDQSIEDQPVVEKTSAATEETNDWFSAMQNMWSNSRTVVNVVCDEEGNEEYRNRGGYLMPGPTPSFVLGGQDEAYHQYRKFKKRKPRKRNVENELRKAAVSTELAPEDRIGPNAEQWRKDQEEYMKKLGGKRQREEEKEEEDKGEEENAIKKSKEELTKKAKLIPIPYKRYILDNDPFREFVYNYRSKLQEAKRKLGQLKKQNKKDCEDEENSLRAEINKYNLRKSKLDICSFVVRVSMSTSDFHVKWAHDLAHVFGMTYAPSRAGTTGAWLFSSNEGEDASSIVQVVKHIRLADCELHSEVHYAAATLPPIEDDTKVVVRRRLKIFREKYDNTICRNMQEAIEAEDRCSFFRTDWRNAYLGELKSLYFTVGNLVRSLARKQASGGKKWCSEGIRGVVIVLEESVAVWCGGLVGAMAGKKGVSLVGGDDMGLSDVEQADIVVGTPEQLLPLLEKSGQMQEEGQVVVTAEGVKRPKHILSTVTAVVLDDVHSLVESPATHTLLKLIREKSKKADSLEVVAVARRIRFDELESIEQSVGYQFPRTALEEPKVGEVTTAEVEEALTTEVPVEDNTIATTEPKDQSSKVRGPQNRPYLNTFNKKNVNKANYRNNKVKEDSKKEETQEAPAKRSREEEVNEVEEENEPKKRLTFLEELELYKTNQKRRKLEEGTSMSDELVKKQKRDLENKMTLLKEEQKKRLENERRAAFEEKRKRREAEEEKRKKEVEKKRKEEDERKRKLEENEKKEEECKRRVEDKEVVNMKESEECKEREEETSAVKEAEKKNDERMEVDDKIEESVERRNEHEEETENTLPKEKRAVVDEESEAITVVENEEDNRRKEMEDREKNMREQLVRKMNLEKVPPKLEDMVTHLNDKAVQLSERARKFNEKMKEDAMKKKAEATKKEEAMQKEEATKKSKTKAAVEKKKSKKKKKEKRHSSDSDEEKKKKPKQKKATKEKKKLSKSDLLKQEQKRKLQEEKRKLEEQIKREILKRQQTLKSDEVLKQEKKRQLLQEKLLEQQLLLQNKLKKEKKRQKMMTKQGEAP